MDGMTVADAAARLSALQRHVLVFAERRRRPPGTLPTRLQEHVLRAIGERGAVDVSEIAGMLEIGRPTASQLLGTMEGRGWLERGLRPEDRRRHAVRLTAQGGAMLQEAEARRARRIAAVLQALTAEERAQVVRLAERLVEVLAAEAGGEEAF